MNIAVLFEVLGAALKIWGSKEQTKYLDLYISLKEAYDEEFNKPLDRRSDAVLDGIESKLRVLGSAFAAAAGKPNA